MYRFICVPKGLAARLAVLAVLLLFSAGCSASSGRNTAPSAAPAAQAPRPAASAGSSAGQASPGQASLDQPSPDRMIIRNVSLSLVVTDVDAALAAITKVASDFGGFVVSADSNESDGKRVGKVSLRVLSTNLDEAISRIKGLAQRVRHETNTAKDVTEEYVDQDAHLRNLQATESQYLQILTTATTIEQILTVRKAISDVRDQIERTQGRLQYLRRSAELATISVDLEPSAAAQSFQVGDWNLGATARPAIQGLINTVLFLATLAIWIVAFAPIWLPAVLLFLWWSRRRARRRVTPPSTVA